MPKLRCRLEIKLEICPTTKSPPSHGLLRGSNFLAFLPEVRASSPIMSAGKFIVTLTADFYDSKGEPKYRDIGLSVLAESPRIEQRVFKEHRKQIGSDQIGDAQGVIVLTPTVSAESVSQ